MIDSLYQLSYWFFNLHTFFHIQFCSVHFLQFYWYNKLFLNCFQFINPLKFYLVSFFCDKCSFVYNVVSLLFQLARIMLSVYRVSKRIILSVIDGSYASSHFCLPDLCGVEFLWVLVMFLLVVCLAFDLILLVFIGCLFFCL